MDTHYNIHARACECVYEAGKGKRNGEKTQNMEKAWDLGL